MPMELLLQVLGYLDSGSLWLVSATCRELYGRREELWNVDKALGRYVDSPPKLRRLMKRWDLMVTGEMVFNFFARTEWEPYMEVRLAQEHEEEFTEYITSEEGYVAEYSFVESVSASVIEAVVLLSAHQIQSLTRRRDGKVIMLRITGRGARPIEDALAECHVAMLCIITYNSAYCVFPSVVAHCGRPGGERGRGGRFASVVSGGRVREVKSSSELSRYRRVGDEWTWAIRHAGGSADSSLESVWFVDNRMGLDSATYIAIGN